MRSVEYLNKKYEEHKKRINELEKDLKKYKYRAKKCEEYKNKNIKLRFDIEYLTENVVKLENENTLLKTENEYIKEVNKENELLLSKAIDRKTHK